jgi:hypothetical protein
MKQKNGERVMPERNSPASSFLKDDVVFKEKWIGFIDILGFKSLVEKAEAGKAMSLPQLLELLKEFGSPEERGHFNKYGPIICPGSSYIQRDLDFRLTQVSDCVVMSSEISPAGVISLVHKCWSAVIKLLSKGIMCRGHITRGLIYHSETQFIGSGYQEAYFKEKMTTFNQNDGEKVGTPFVEVDKKVCDYAKSVSDSCVRKMFLRFVAQNKEVAAISPLESLGHSFVIAGQGHAFDPGKEKESNQNVREAMRNYKDRVMEYADSPEADEKAKHYFSALENQLNTCDRTDEIIDLLGRQYPCSPDAVVGEKKKYYERS